MNLVNLSVFSVGNSPAGTTDKLSLAGKSGDLSQEFFQMLLVDRQSKFIHSDETKTASGGSMVADEAGAAGDRQPLKNLIDFMDSVKSQLEFGNDKAANALPVSEVKDAFSDLFGFLKALHNHLTAGDNVDFPKLDGQSHHKPDQSMDQSGTTELIEFERVLNDLSTLLGKNGFGENALGAPEPERTKPPTQQGFDSLIIEEPIVSVRGANPSEPLGPKTSDGITVSDLSGTLESEFKQAAKTKIISSTPDTTVSNAEIISSTPDTTVSKTEIISSTPDTTVSKTEIDLKLDEEQAFKDMKLIAKPDHEVSLSLPLASLTDENGSVEDAAQNLAQDVDLSRKRMIERALSPLRELVTKLLTLRPDQMVSLTQTEKYELVEATQILRSINFEDLNFFASFKVHKPGDFAPESYVPSVVAETENTDWQTLKLVAQTVLAEDEAETAQPALNMARTAFVSFPPGLFENTPTFGAVLQVDYNDVDPLSSLLQYFETGVEDIPVSLQETDQISEDENAVVLGQDTSRVILQTGEVTSNRVVTPENSVELRPEKQTLHMDMTLPSQSIAGEVEQPAETKQILRTETALPLQPIAGETDKSVSTVMPLTKNIVSSNEVASRDFIVKDVAVSKKAKTTQSELMDKAVNRKGSSQTLRAGWNASASHPHSAISEVNLVEQENGEKSHDILAQSGQPPRLRSSLKRYDRPVMQSGRAVLEYSEVVQLIGEAKVKERGIQNTVNSTMPKGELADSKSQSMGKLQTDVQKGNPNSALAKTSLLGSDSMIDPEEGKVKKIVNGSITEVKEALIKKVFFEQKPQGAETEKYLFELPQPKLKHTSAYRDVPSKPQSMIDFSARAADDIISQVKIEIRNKSKGSTSAATFAAMNVEPGMLQQSSPVMANHNAGAQTQTGSERIEKWIDMQLDLTSRGWVNNLAKTMVSAINRGQQRLMLTLSPPSLGRINIIFNAKTVGLDLRIHAERKATLSLLGDAEVKLVSNLENAGHKVNNLSYADMSSSANEFGDNQSSNNGKDEADQRNPSEQEKVSDSAQVAQNKAVAKNIDDASLVNITV